ncbi:histidinol-phosphate transaminase [Allomuricauda sp. d1]|uniref:histidinol-phosphate transaminase n=1 Tax=Allomuricauda sp. d1 TaxID=3136725 RepID=UPI0031D10745
MNKNFNIKSLIRENVKNLKPYSSARDEFTDFEKDMVFLDANENPFDNGVNRYPDPHQQRLKAVLAEQKGVSVNQILLGNGSDEVLDLIFRAFCEPNVDNVLTLPPTYGMYKVLAATNAVENHEVLLTDDFQPNVEKVLDSVDEQTKIIFLCSPNNPTGNHFSVGKIKYLLLNFHGLVVIDEAYIDFSEKESWLSKLKDFPNLVVTQTLSKAYGMAGIRLGICYASEAIISILKKIKPPYNVNELTQQKALERISNTGLVAKEVENIRAEREKLVAAMAEIPYVKTIFSTEANFVLVRVDDADLRYEQLIKKGIVVRNRSNQPLCENTLRFTVGTIEENEKLMTTLKEISNG